MSLRRKESVTVGLAAGPQFPLPAGFLGPCAKQKVQRMQCVQPCCCQTQRTDKPSPAPHPSPQLPCFCEAPFIIARLPVLPGILMTHDTCFKASAHQETPWREVTLKPGLWFHHFPLHPALPHHTGQGTGLCSFPELFSFLEAFTEGWRKPANRRPTFSSVHSHGSPPATYLQRQARGFVG